jgi:hypothetical protein
LTLLKQNPNARLTIFPEPIGLTELANRRGSDGSRKGTAAIPLNSDRPTLDELFVNTSAQL